MWCFQTNLNQHLERNSLAKRLCYPYKVTFMTKLEVMEKAIKLVNKFFDRFLKYYSVFMTDGLICQFV